MVGAFERFLSLAEFAQIDFKFGGVNFGTFMDSRVLNCDGGSDGERLSQSEMLGRERHSECRAPRDRMPRTLPAEINGTPSHDSIRSSGWMSRHSGSRATSRKSKERCSNRIFCRNTFPDAAKVKSDSAPLMVGRFARDHEVRCILHEKDSRDIIGDQLGNTLQQSVEDGIHG